jgi:hypothetical protein
MVVVAALDTGAVLATAATVVVVAASVTVVLAALVDTTAVVTLLADVLEARDPVSRGELEPPHPLTTRPASAPTINAFVCFRPMIRSTLRVGAAQIGLRTRHTEQITSPTGAPP